MTRETKVLGTSDTDDDTAEWTSVLHPVVSWKLRARNTCHEHVSFPFSFTLVHVRRLEAARGSWQTPG